jgi:hypothetical protein
LEKETASFYIKNNLEFTAEIKRRSLERLKRDDNKISNTTTRNYGLTLKSQRVGRHRNAAR